ncbi:hypothetical protein HZH66_006151 [Vespula vulgaris]|uniref:Uncharacterized protein n=2 Tax=Vespula vulgaris TaxID=7454 RepID=A0A834N9B0_VESVU|nr:hypothetical protein HZH66_006151 [Vespula vulgaris]
MRLGVYRWWITGDDSDRQRQRYATLPPRVVKLRFQLVLSLLLKTVQVLSKRAFIVTSLITSYVGGINTTYVLKTSRLSEMKYGLNLLQADDKQDMEISETDVQITNRPIDFISVYIKEENDECETEFNDVEIIAAAQHFCSIEIKETKGYDKNYKQREFNIDNDSNWENRKNIESPNSNTDAMQSSEACNIGSILTDSICLDTLDSDTTNDQIKKQINQSSEVFESQSEDTETNYNISTVATSNQFLESLSLDIKKENKQSSHKSDSDGIYMTEWLCDVNGETNLRLKVLKNDKQEVQIPTDIEATITPIAICKDQTLDHSGNLTKEETKKYNTTKKRTKLKSSTLNDYEERLRKKAECMREKRRKLYENESEEQRVQRLAREAAKRREMRMYYETPEQRRKRLDAEAARKRQYRLYNETPDDRRKRLDREAERRRMKRLSLYASESPEQRRERLNRESAKRREARLNQYAKETEEERKERLRKDALRAREIRFTRSAVETEEERRRSWNSIITDLPN